MSLPPGLSRWSWPDLIRPSFVRQHPVVDEARQAVGVEILPQALFIVVLAHPVEEGLAPLGLARIAVEEGVENAGARLGDVAEAPGELAQRLARRAALQQHEQAGRKTGAVGA